MKTLVTTAILTMAGIMVKAQDSTLQSAGDYIFFREMTSQSLPKQQLH